MNIRLTTSAKAIPWRQDRKVWSAWWSVPVSIIGALAVIWLVLAVALWLAKPDELGMRDVMRLLPDLLRLMKRLATDPEMPRRIRIGLLLSLAFVASPIDIIPDFIPVIGFADDVILVALVLRWVTRTAGSGALAKHWPGTPDGTVNLRSCGRSANRVSLIRHTRPGESRRRTGENRPRTAQVDNAPLLRSLPVDLEELASLLEGDPLSGGGRIDLRSGACWPHSVEYGEDDGDENDEDRWLHVAHLGSREGYQDMELFIATVKDPAIVDRLQIAITGKGAFRRFGVVVIRMPLGSADVDAFSLPFADHPVIVLGSEKDDRARSRFDSAHELAHLVMHGEQIWGMKEVEKQANQFSAAFLMPADQISNQLPQTVDWPTLFELKGQWQVSLAALLMRARVLGRMSESTYLTAVKAASARGWRRREPVPLGSPERPSTLLAFLGDEASTPARSYLPTSVVESVAAASGAA